MQGLDVIIKQNKEAATRFGINKESGYKITRNLNNTDEKGRQINDSGSVQVQGDWSVLIGTPKGFVEARNLYGEAANFFSRDLAKEFALTLPSARVVRFHTPEWSEILAEK